MTELLVVLGLSLLGLTLAAQAARSAIAAPLGTPEMNRIANLVREAAEGFSRGQLRISAALSALVGGAVFLAYGLRAASPKDPVSAFDFGIWTTLSFGVGAASTIVLGQLATTLCARVGVRVASGAQRSLDESLRTALRSGSATALLAGATSALGLSVLMLGVLVQRGVLGANPGQALAIVPALPLLLWGHALGAGFAALFMQLSGGAFAAGSDSGADLGGREAGLEDDSIDNPATIAQLAGDCAGESSNRVTAAFATAAVCDLAVMGAGALAYASDGALPSALGLLALPLVARGFGIVGAAFGALVVRTDEREGSASPVRRGMLIALLMHAVGVAGTVQWLLPSRFALALACAGLGLLGALLLLALTNRVTAVAGPVRRLAELSRGGPTHTALGALGLGLDLCAAAALVVTVLLTGAEGLARALGGAASVELGVAMALVGFTGCATYLLAVDVAGSQADLALGLVRMTVGSDQPQVRGRLLMLDVDGTAHRASSRAHAGVAAGLAGVLLVRALWAEASRRGVAPTPTPPWSLFIAVTLGLAIVVWLCARAIMGAARCARRILDEVRRQLQDHVPAGPDDEPPPRRSSVVVSNPVVPDYAPCVEMSTRFALRHALTPTLASVGLLVAGALALRLGPDGDKESIVGSVAAVAVTTTVAGVFAVLGLSSTGAALSNAKKYIVTGAHGGRLLVDESGARAENPTYHAVVVGDTVGDPLKGAAAPALLTFVQLVPALLLVLLPFLL